MSVQLMKNEANYSIVSGTSIAKVNTVLHYINEILEKVHRTPDLGNKVDPLDELLYLTIAQRTRIDLAREVFNDLQRAFKPWHKALVPRYQGKLRQILKRGGRGKFRYRAVTEILTEVKKRIGKTSLEFLREYSMEKAEEFLLSLPWVGRKTAFCVLMYSLGHPVFPADSNIIRIFKRMKVLEAVGVSLMGVDHRTAQKRIAPLMRGEIAYPLHVNMVMHGRKVCHERNPRCGSCPVRMFCQFYRDLEHRMARNFRFTMIDLFCGAGGISYGFARTGIRPVLAVDSHEPSCETYRLNIPWMNREKIINRDIREIKNKEIQELAGHQRIDILVAGVPCQGFSKVGLKSKPSLRKKRPPEKEAINKLFMEVIRWTDVLKPRIVLLENVPAMGDSKIFFEDSKVRVQQLLEENFNRMSYSTTTVYLNSADFGVPQIRKRLFFIASRSEALTEQFEKSLLMFWNRKNNEKQKRNMLPLKVALRGLPCLAPRAGEIIAAAGENYPTYDFKSRYEEFVYDNASVVFNHVARYHNEDDMMIISSLQKAEMYRKLVLRKPEVIRKRKRKVYSLNNFHDKFYRLDPERPCRTIVSHLAKDGNSFIHPLEDRSITVREAARIQSFPDSFMFTGSRTAQFIQVGNAVPPLLARIFAQFFKKCLKETGMLPKNQTRKER